jgi:hypothetical protein
MEVGESVTDSADERAAREFLEDLIAGGRAVEIMHAYSEHGQSCSYVYGILQHVAHEVDSGVDPEIVNFARNLLDDWSK